jgi:hypothetical protein
MCVSESKRVIVTGATGLLGKALCARLAEKGYSVVVFSRSTQRARRSVPGATDYVVWDPMRHGAWAEVLNGAYGVIHLAGASIFGKRWSDDYKTALRESRVVSTRVLFSSLIAAQRKPAVFLSGSAVGYYGFRDDTPLDEQASAGSDFLAQMCVAWEQEAREAAEIGIRTVLLRTGVVLDAREGALPLMVLPFRFFVGGPILPGSQWISWVHRDDAVELMVMALENADVEGALNLTAPEPATNRDFMATLGRVVGSPSWLPVPGFGLKVVLGDVTDILVEGQRVMPRKALDLGYQFRYPTAEQALSHLLKR